MDVVVDEVVAVLEVLAFGDAVGADEDVDLAGLVGQDRRLLLGAWREEREQGLESRSPSSAWFFGVSVPVTLPV